MTNLNLFIIPFIAIAAIIIIILLGVMASDILKSINQLRKVIADNIDIEKAIVDEVIKFTKLQTEINTLIDKILTNQDTKIDNIIDELNKLYYTSDDKKDNNSNNVEKDTK